MKKKYELTTETRSFDGRILHRIKRIEDELIGGWIESENNLSQEGDCFVYDNAMVYGDAEVCDNAIVFDNAKVYGRAIIGNDAEVSGNTMVYSNAMVFGNSRIFGDVKVSGNSRVFGEVKISDNAEIYGNARIYGEAMVYGYSKVFGRTRVYGEAKVWDKAEISDENIIGQITTGYKDIFQHQCKSRMLTAILTENDEILYSIGCQNNITKEVFLDRIYNEGGGLEENPHRKEYLKLIPLIESYFRIK